MRCAPILLLLIGNLVAFAPAPTELLAHAGTQKTAYAVDAGVNDDADSLEDDSKDLNTGAEDDSAEEDADPAGEDSLDAADTSSQDSAFEEAYSPDTTGNDSLDDDSLWISASEARHRSRGFSRQNMECRRVHFARIAKWKARIGKIWKVWEGILQHRYPLNLQGDIP